MTHRGFPFSTPFFRFCHLMNLHRLIYSSRLPPTRRSPVILAPFTLKRWYQIGSPKLPTVLPSKVDLELTPDTPKGTMTCQYMDPAIACTDFSLLALFRFLGSGWTAASFSYRTTCQRYSPGAWQHLWVSTATPCCNVLTCYYEGDISS